MSVRLATLPEHVHLVAKLRAAANVPAEAIDELLALEVTVREVPRGEDVVREHERPSHSSLVLTGVACRYKATPEGKRQIMSIHIAGDMPDLQSLHLRTMDHSMGALAAARIAVIPHEQLRRLVRANPTLCEALWRETLIDAAIYREWLMAVGRLPAHARVAHILCELMLKHRVAGLARGDSFRLGVTQIDLADALGLTAVHVNRVLQDLRGQGLIRLDRNAEATILDWRRLQQLAAFDPTYLHLEGEGGGSGRVQHDECGRRRAVRCRDSTFTCRTASAGSRTRTGASSPISTRRARPRGRSSAP